MAEDESGGPDDEARHLLDTRSDAELPPVWKLTPEEARRTRRAWREAHAAEGPQIESVRDLVVDGGATGIPVRLYLPTFSPGLPLLIYLHGGGWVLGDLGHSDALSRTLAALTGWAVLNVDYRLAPEHAFPAAVDDAYEVALWAAENTSRLGVDHATLVVAGSSAGGNLAAVTAIRARDRGKPKLAGQILVCPVTDHDFDTPSYQQFGEGHLVSRREMAWYWEKYCPVSLRSRAEASPLRAESLSGLPPALVITAECDPLRDEGEAYARRMRAEGSTVVQSRYTGALHGFLGMPVQQRKVALAQIRDFLSGLRPITSP
jgi:acetyl esterase